MFMLSLSWLKLTAGGCSRIPQGATGERSAVDDNFKILIDGNPTTFIPDHQYNGDLATQPQLSRAKLHEPLVLLLSFPVVSDQPEVH